MTSERRRQPRKPHTGRPLPVTGREGPSPVWAGIAVLAVWDARTDHPLCEDVRRELHLPDSWIGRRVLDAGLVAGALTLRRHLLHPRQP